MQVIWVPFMILISILVAMKSETVWDDPQLVQRPRLRAQEELENNHLWGKQLISGGSGEGTQFLRPDGKLQNRVEVKTEPHLPAYCDPPNPCPYGVSADYGCLDEYEFENTAEYSRRYQAKQESCVCDSEHNLGCFDPLRSFHDYGDIAGNVIAGILRKDVPVDHDDSFSNNPMSKPWLPEYSIALEKHGVLN